MLEEQTSSAVSDQLVLGDDPDAIRQGRHFVAEWTATAVPELVDDAELVASELLANAIQHGAPPVHVRVLPGSGRLRVEVEDTSARMPVRSLVSLENMTGRGLLLVDKLSERWGVRPEAGGGKTVWAELAVGGADLADDEGEIDVDAFLAAWEDEQETDEKRYAVTLGDVPTDLLIAAKAHIDNLVREFSLATTGAASDGVALPAQLSHLIDTVVNSFGEARSAIKRQALAAAERGEVRTRLTLSLPLSAAETGEAYLAALDEADSYARAARLLTLETPPQHRIFRRWYVQAVAEQLRARSRGEVISTTETFEDRLLSEVGELAVAQRASERAARLQAVSAGLARAGTPEDVAIVVVTEGVAALGASGGSLLMLAEDGQHLAVPGSVGYGQGLVAELRAEGIDSPLPAATALRTGEAVWLESRQERDERFPDLTGLEPGTVAMCAVPLELGGRRLGALRFSFDSPRLFDEHERSFVSALAAQTAQVLERTELFLAERLARSAAETLAARLSRLAKVTARLAFALDMGEIADAVVTEAAEALDARVATLSVLENDGTLLIAGVRGAREDSMQRWARVSVNDDLPVAEAVRTGQTVAVLGNAAIEERWPVFVGQIPEERSLLCLPLQAGGTRLGAISLMFLGQELPAENEMAFLMALTDTCAQSLHRMQLTAQAEKSAGRLRFLADASDELGRSLDYRTTLARVAQLAVPYLADWCAIEMVDDSGQLQTLVAEHSDPTKLQLALDLQQRYPADMDAPMGGPNVVRTGQSELIESITDEMLVEGTRDEEHLRLARELQLGSALVLPLSVRGKVLGTLTLVHAESGRRYSVDDLPFAEELARRASIAVENAHLYSETRDAAVRLQRALLPSDITPIPGWEVATHYNPAGEHTEVGGDWYDVIPLGPHRMVTVVGDVMGRGVAAASAMAQMRSAIRAFATVDPSPETVLTLLDQMFETLELQQLVTLLYAVVDTATGDAQVASAGHLPPLLVVRGEPAVRVQLDNGIALGAGVDRRRSRTVQLPPGATLLAYTDGLVERRGEDIDESIDRLAEIATTAADLPVDQFLDVLTHAAARHDDDVTALALRRA